MGIEALFSALLHLVAEAFRALSVLCVEICFSFGELSLLAALPVFGRPSAEPPFTSGALAKGERDKGGRDEP